MRRTPTVAELVRKHGIGRARYFQLEGEVRRRHHRGSPQRWAEELAQPRRMKWASTNPPWSSQDLVETLSARRMSRFELLRTQPTEMTVTPRPIIKRVDIVGHLRGRQPSVFVNLFLDPFLFQTAPLSVFRPVSYRFVIDVDFSTGRRQYVIGMDYSCYPNYEVYINDKPFLQEQHSCATPLGLLQGRVLHLLLPGVIP